MKDAEEIIVADDLNKADISLPPGQTNYSQHNTPPHESTLSDDHVFEEVHVNSKSNNTNNK